MTTQVRSAKLNISRVPERQSPVQGHGADAMDMHLTEVRQLRALAERHARAHRSLRAMVRRFADPNGEARYVDVQPFVPVATISQHPRAKHVDGDPSWPSAPVRPTQPLIAHVGDDCLSLSDAIVETVGVSVMGLRGRDLDNVVEAVAQDQMRRGDFKPVFLTDSPDFSAFVSRGFSFEYLSSFRGYLSRDGEAQQKDRRDRIVAKWGISRLIDRDDARKVHRDHPPLAALARHNEEMSPSVHNDRFAWIIETLRTSLSMERFDVVTGLADYLLVFFNTLEKKHVIPAARVLCRKFIACGELEQLRQFLFKNIASIEKDDSLFTWFSTYCTGSTEFLKDFATLPSGKINAYYLSKRMALTGDQMVPSLLTGSEGATPDTSLLLANFFATRNESSLYKMFVNRVLGKVGGPLIAKVDLAQANFLDTLSFVAAPAASDQTDLVSIIMSAHNAADTLGYAVRSILAQSYRNIELLICDDGSTDSTRSDLEKFRSDPRVRLFQSVEKQGTYGVRNSLIAEAKGAYVTFHDSDDLAFPGRIERQLFELKKQGAAAVVGQWYRVTAQGEFVFSSDQMVARLAVVSLFAPRELFERFGPYRSARIGADTEFYEKLRMTLGVQSIRQIQEPLMLGLASGTSLTRSPGIEATEDGYRAPTRRAYATAAARLRHTGELNGLPSIEEILENNGLLMSLAGAVPLEPQS